MSALISYSEGKVAWFSEGGALVRGRVLDHCMEQLERVFSEAAEKKYRGAEVRIFPSSDGGLVCDLMSPDAKSSLPFQDLLADLNEDGRLGRDVGRILRHHELIQKTFDKNCPTCD